MLATRQKVLRRFWYPVLRADALGEAPRALTLLGEAVVLWRDAAGDLACLQDRCCHRTAKLSKGFVEAGRIVCGYHGWTFDTAGTLVRIPQAAKDARVGNVRIPAYRTAERYGYIWICLGDPLQDIPELPEAALPGFRQIHQFCEEWQIGALRLMENSFDNAHVSYVHRQSFGDVESPASAGNRIEDFAGGFHLRTQYAVKNRGIQKQNLRMAEEDTVRTNDATWFMPFSRRLGIAYPNGLKHTIFTAATPVTDDRALIVQFCYRNDSEADTPAADVIAFDRQVTMEDRDILEATDPDVPLDDADGEEMHMLTDRPGLQMRRRFRTLLAEHGEVEIRQSPA